MKPLTGIFILLFSGYLSASCQQSRVPLDTALYEGQSINYDKRLTTIAFGSCNRIDRDQQIWASILANRPDLWIWLGDNVYADTYDMQEMKRQYLTQKHFPGYRAVRGAMPVVGIWDDHDYGVNDGGKSYSKKQESQQLLLDFLDVPPGDPARSREGAYQSYTFGPKGQKVHVILLDGRYFRDTLERGTPGSGLRYKPNPEGDILGEAQWKWLKATLRKSDAQVHIIGCGIQFLPEEQKFEKWANFPKARRRLLDLLAKTRPKGLLLISGDRHIAELSHYKPAPSGPDVYELTSSGLTHTWSLGSSAEPNPLRIGDMVIARNFGLIRIDWSGTKPEIRLQIRGLDNVLLLDHALPSTNP
ncbi:MAG: alkaline phosphatase D family protein [Saprospiraceae bacterium]|jgi:alkaline phosphatase D